MSKKKKIKKPVYVPKEERRKKNPMPKKTKIIIASVCGALALALVLFVLLFDDGSLPVKNGIVQVEGDNWLVTNLSKQNRYRYYKQAEISTPEGFALESGSSLKSDKNETAFWFNSEDEASPIKSFYVSGNAESAPELVESVQPQFLAFYGPESVGETQIGPVGGIIGQYFTTYYEDEVPVEEEAEEAAQITETKPEETPAEPEAEPPADDEPAEAEPVADDTDEPAEEEEAPPAHEAEEEEETPAEPQTRIERSMQLVAYFPAQRNSSIVFVMTVRIEEGAERPTIEEMLELAAPLASCIDVYVPDAK